MSVILRVPCDEWLHTEVLSAAEDDDRPMASWIRVAIREKLERLGRIEGRDDNQPDD